MAFEVTQVVRFKIALVSALQDINVFSTGWKSGRVTGQQSAGFIFQSVIPYPKVPRCESDSFGANKPMERTFGTTAFSNKPTLSTRLSPFHSFGARGLQGGISPHWLQNRQHPRQCVAVTVSKSTRTGFRKRCAMVCLWLSFVLWLGLTLCFGFSWDAVAVLTLYPFWAWALLGGIIGFAAWRLSGDRRMLLIPTIWLVTNFCFADNAVQVYRGMLRQPALDDSIPNLRFRVVTLNCAGSAAAAVEALSLKPDFILLQEIPSTNDVARLARDCFGDQAAWVAGLDCAIISKTPLSPVGARLPPQYVQAVTRLATGKTVLVTSLRLLPPEGRMDLWNPGAWTASASNRRVRRQQLQWALERDGANTDVAEILGGDFNAPANDAVFRLLNRFLDAHKEAGRGWGNTALNQLPIARPDQIWVKKLRVVFARAIRTQNSDHRMVMADLELL